MKSRGCENRIVNIMAAFAEYEKTMIVSKLRGARQRMKAKTGRCEGAKPYAALPGEAAVIERMKALRASKHGVRPDRRRLERGRG